MARYFEPTPEQEAGWKEWVASRPDNVRVVAQRFEPFSLYRLKTSGHRVTVQSFGETVDGAILLTVNVSPEFNFIVVERDVFDVDPDDLEPCELPPSDELVGTFG
jgi:hypothetical protein